MTIQVDSRLVKPGDLFISIPCKNEIQHIIEAYKNGASFIFSELDTKFIRDLIHKYLTDNIITSNLVTSDLITNNLVINDSVLSNLVISNSVTDNSCTSDLTTNNESVTTKLFGSKANSALEASLFKTILIDSKEKVKNTSATEQFETILKAISVKTTLSQNSLAENIPVTEQSETISKTVPVVETVSDAWLLASKLSKIQFSKQPKIAIAITGTSGKSSVAHFVHQLWYLLGIRSANLGTLGLFIDNKKCEDIDVPNLTTPDAFNLHKILNYLSELHINNIVFEASSAALVQKRLHSVDISVAVFTNFASDHLDYHHTRNEYFKAKLILFKDLIKNNTPAIVYGDDNWLVKQIRDIHSNVITFGFNDDNNIYVEDIKIFLNRIDFTLVINNQKYKNVQLNLCGKFQLLNILASIAVLYSLGTNIDPKLISSITPLKGRMEHVKKVNNGDVFIDYAHTSDALENALKEFKTVCKNKLIVILGCGGNRDTSKRKEFGKLAQKYADIVIVTDDNPRTEDPEKIRKEILSECAKGIEIANRAEAIKFALDKITVNDIVVIFGKGHEEYQIYGHNAIPFSDYEIVNRYI